jgi:hypothetical protein
MEEDGVSCRYYVRKKSYSCVHIALYPPLGYSIME